MPINILKKYIHTYISTYIHTHIHTYVHTYIHAYIHTCIHTYLHTYIHTRVKAHNGIQGNELADTLAKEAAQDVEERNIVLSQRDREPPKKAESTRC